LRCAPSQRRLQARGKHRVERDLGGLLHRLHADVGEVLVDADLDAQHALGEHVQVRDAGGNDADQVIEVAADQAARQQLGLLVNVLLEPREILRVMAL
jgi:hypothetical protein